MPEPYRQAQIAFPPNYIIVIKEINAISETIYSLWVTLDSNFHLSARKFTEWMVFLLDQT
jgi:hypothetical protein